MLGDFLPADFHCGLLLLPVQFLRPQIHLRRLPQHQTQRVYDRGILHFMVLSADGGQLHAVGRVDDHLISGLKGETVWVKEIGFSSVSEFNTDNLGHSDSPIL